MTLASNPIDLNEAYERLTKRGEEWAELDAAASLLEEGKKSFRAQLAIKHLPDMKSLNRAEIMAEADPEYREYVKDMCDARLKANIAKVNYDAAKTWCDLFRTQQATTRAEMQMR